ncbi:hypothetical protein DBR40_05340 [Pedobacter sp. KBW01]|uniref:hypothetical protein n=1 Tax=Pedobacter sp. KBW01 TaxID=2153364 RepID=UPI000F5B6A8B|nr:hypothetical protein [Pedobacter sp. KBW01]RQO79145.1 hypothetical protein DBR40_05340 [Pedobacter sp. KBW01]
MQVEYKTEKGTVLFVKVPDEAKKFQIDFERYGVVDDFDEAIVLKCENDNHKFDPIFIYDDNWQIISLTIDIREDQLTEILSPKIGILYEMFGYDYLTTDIFKCFKSLMHRLQVHEVNPDPLTCCSGSIQSGCGCMGFPYNYSSEKELDAYCDAKERTGKWLVLFNPNEPIK